MKGYIVGIFLIGIRIIYTQVNSVALRQMIKQDSADVNVLAVYPENVRQNMFKVSSHPEGVSKVNDIQKK